MTKSQFECFSAFRTDFKSYCEKLNSDYSEILAPLQAEAAKKDTPDYPLETPVVYNTALDDITEKSQINLIVIGDNPGKDEQLAKNNKYLVGQSGKIAAGFFQRNPELKTDFRQNAIILNKTPVHTAKTSHLKFLLKNGTKEIQNLIAESQIYMAQKTAELHQNLLKSGNGDFPELWLIGYAELKNKGLFTNYRDTLKAAYSNECWDKVFVFQHFSMNRFLIDLKTFRENNSTKSLTESINELGLLHKKEIFSDF